MALHTRLGSAWLYSATEVHVFNPTELAAHPFLCRLGPDVLDPTLTAPRLAARLLERAFKGRALGGLYLDQGFVAGVGNYLRSEILFFAGLRAGHRPADLSPAQVQRLAGETLAVAQRAYRARGVTNEPQRVAQLAGRGLRYANLRFAVFARDGEPCHVCATPIERAVVSSRRLYYCPRCQH